MKLAKCLVHAVTSERFTRNYALAIAVGYAALVVASPAEAQTLRRAGESIFTAIYSAVGVIGAICCLASAINWKAGGLIGGDPKKMFMNSVTGTGLGFGVVGIVQFIKEAVSSGGSVSGL
jgi:hypothetical protein